MEDFSEMIDLVKMVLDTDEEITIDQNVDTIPGWDSVNALRLYTQLGKGMDKKIPVVSYMQAKTLYDIYQLVNNSH